LKTDNTHTIAIVATAMPITDINEITLMALCDFFENKYLRATKNGRFNTDSLYSFFNNLSIFSI